MRGTSAVRSAPFSLLRASAWPTGRHTSYGTASSRLCKTRVSLSGRSPAWSFIPGRPQPRPSTASRSGPWSWAARKGWMLAAMLSAHRSAAFGVYVLAALGGDDAAGGRSSGCAVAGAVAVEEAGKHVDEFEQQRVDLGLLVSGVLGAVAGDEPVPSGGCLLFVLGGVVPGLVARWPLSAGLRPGSWCRLVLVVSLW